MSMDRDRDRDSRDRNNNYEEANMRRRSRFVEDADSLDLNDISAVKRFVTEHGKIIPSRLTGVSSKMQRKIKMAVRSARSKGLL